MVCRFRPQNQQLQFGDLDLKITVTVCWFGSQNQADFSLAIAPQNLRRGGGGGSARDTSCDLAACFV
jgi:hypothetical protein